MPYSPVSLLIIHTHQNCVPSEEVWLGLSCKITKKNKKTMKSAIILDMNFWSIPDAKTPKQLSILWMKAFILPSTPNRDMLNTEGAHRDDPLIHTSKQLLFYTLWRRKASTGRATVDTYMSRILDRRKTDTWTESSLCSSELGVRKHSCFALACFNHLGTPKTGMVGGKVRFLLYNIWIKFRKIVS